MLVQDLFGVTSNDLIVDVTLMVTRGKIYVLKYPEKPQIKTFWGRASYRLS